MSNVSYRPEGKNGVLRLRSIISGEFPLNFRKDTFLTSIPPKVFQSLLVTCLIFNLLSLYSVGRTDSVRRQVRLQLSAIDLYRWGEGI